MVAKKPRTIEGPQEMECNHCPYREKVLSLNEAYAKGWIRLRLGSTEIDVCPSENCQYRAGEIIATGIKVYPNRRRN